MATAAAAARVYQVVVSIFEPPGPLAVVVHVFQGRTRPEAWHYHASHRKTDAFMRACEDRGSFDRGRVTCVARVWEGWVGSAATFRVRPPARRRGAARPRATGAARARR